MHIFDILKREQIRVFILELRGRGNTLPPNHILTGALAPPPIPLPLLPTPMELPHFNILQWVQDSSRAQVFDHLNDVIGHISRKASQ